MDCRVKPGNDEIRMSQAPADSLADAELAEQRIEDVFDIDPACEPS
jgi:hypothetical protein